MAGTNIEALLNRTKYGNQVVRTVNKLEEPTVTFSYHPHSSSGEDHKVIVMPFPVNLQMDQQVVWDQEDAGIVGHLTGKDGTAGEYAASIRDFYRAFESSIGTSLMKNVAGGVGSLAGLNSTAIKGKIAKIQGKIMNPNKEMFFSNVNFRSVGMNFKLMPTNKEQSVAMNDAVDAFNWGALPDYADSASGGNRFITYPGLWKIDFNVALSKFLPDIQLSVLSGIQLDYGSTGNVSLHSDGAPVAIDMTLLFTETTIRTKKDYGEGKSGEVDKAWLEKGIDKIPGVTK